MPMLGIRIIYRGNNSTVGHMYVTFTSDDGKVQAFGNYTDGVSSVTDMREHETREGPPGTNGVPDISRDFAVSQDAFNKALESAKWAENNKGDLSKQWGFYDPLQNSCVDFTWWIMREAGITAPTDQFEGYFWPKDNRVPLDDYFYDYYRRPEFNREFNRAISATTISNPDPLVKDIKYLPWVDPLVLDLDGDGLEITPLSAGVQFDTNADTIRTATAWVGADDGLLVLDRNGNGQIDSARELFGDETLLGGGKKAAHGFAALAELDVGGAAGATGGAGDGIFDAKDAQFGAVRVWRDLNQDGISQAGELQSMAEAGIASIALASTATETSYGDAQLVQSGSFARADGSEGQAGSFILAVDHAVATHPPIPLSAEAAALPQVQGSGWVRGLQEAATLNPQLLGLYGQTAAAGNRGAFTGSLGELLLEWGRQSEYITASEQALAEDGIGLILRGPGSEQEMAWMDAAVRISNEDRENFRSTLSAADRGAFDTMREEMVGDLEKLYAYEAFTGYTFLDWDELKTHLSQDAAMGELGVPDVDAALTLYNANRKKFTAKRYRNDRNQCALRKRWKPKRPQAACFVEHSPAWRVRAQ